MPTKITANEVRVEGDKITVSGAGAKALSTSLVQKNSVTLAEMAAAIGFVHPTDISLGKDGTVIINNANAAKKISQLSSADPSSNLWDTNCGCK